jgi:hypothetical protein
LEQKDYQTVLTLAFMYRRVILRRYSSLSREDRVKENHGNPKQQPKKSSRGLLVVGAMNLAAMAILAAAITIERIAPRPAIAARAAGTVAIVVGVVATARALRVG